MRLSRGIGIALVVLVAATVGAGVWFAVRHNGASGQNATSSSTLVSAKSLQALVAALGRPVYWAGRRNGVSYEFTESADRRVYIRYLPAGVAAGSAKPYLTVASYPVASAFATTSTAAGRQGMVKLTLPGGAVAFYSSKRPTNVYIAYPKSNVQIEVFDPSAGAAHQLVSAGSIQRVSAGSAFGAGAPAKAEQTTKPALATLARTLGRPLYWLGPIAGRSLELRRTPDGRVYVRYLPAGVAAGSAKPYLTVATYPLANGLAATKAAQKRFKDSVAIPLQSGAVAFYSSARPTNIYVAFPGVPEQIEVFDPTGRVARQLVAKNKVTPVS